MVVIVNNIITDRANSLAFNLILPYNFFILLKHITLALITPKGANSVVNSSFLEPDITVAGAPARKVSIKGSKNLLVNATEIWKQKRLGLRQGVSSNVDCKVTMY